MTERVMMRIVAASVGVTLLVTYWLAAMQRWVGHP